MGIIQVFTITNPSFQYSGPIGLVCISTHLKEKGNLQGDTPLIIFHLEGLAISSVRPFSAVRWAYLPLKVTVCYKGCETAHTSVL